MTPREVATLIRKGAAMRPQCTGQFFMEGDSCAIGAALEAAGVRDEVLSYMEKERCDPYELASTTLGVNTGLLYEIYTMNDTGHTREQVADWLDTLDVSKPKDAQTFDDFMKATMVAVELEKPVTSSIDSLAK